MRFFVIAFALAIIGEEIYAEENAAINLCREHFFEGIEPTYKEEHENKEVAVILCKKYRNYNFFALSYNNTRKAADWTAYRLSVENLGPNACRTKSRMHWKQFFGMCKKNIKICTEVFYKDNDLINLNLDELLSGAAYSGTGFDRGHQAPAAAFAWNGCGWFHTFTMANISPQRKSLNRNSWKKLEKAVLYWAVSKGNLFVVTGPIYKAVHKIHPWLEDKKNAKNHKEHLEYPGLEMIRNGADIPTASYKVIVDPEHNRAVAFLIPNGSTIVPWREMVVQVSLVEELTGLTFSVPSNQKNKTNLDLIHWPTVPKDWKQNSCEDQSTSIVPAIGGKKGRENCLQ